MKNIGEILKNARDKKRYSLKKVESDTKIKREFIEAIEKAEWLSLPDFTVVSGFVKNLASFLGMNPKTALALLKRDYPLKKISISPKPDIGGKFVWTPKYTFGIGIFMVLLAIFGYLGFQYIKFGTAPTLEVTEPKDGYVATAREVLVDGKTDPDATVKVNNQSVLVSDDGKFSTNLEIFEGTKEIVVVAISRSGKETMVTRKLVTEIK
jgi:cytoskeletal protein RodZ